jgi:hypothetical protein
MIIPQHTALQLKGEVVIDIAEQVSDHFDEDGNSIHETHEGCVVSRGTTSTKTGATIYMSHAIHSDNLLNLPEQVMPICHRHV